MLHLQLEHSKTKIKLCLVITKIVETLLASWVFNWLKTSWAENLRLWIRKGRFPSVDKQLWIKANNARAAGKLVINYLGLAKPSNQITDRTDRTFELFGNVNMNKKTAELLPILLVEIISDSVSLTLESSALFRIKVSIIMSILFFKMC